MRASLALAALFALSTPAFAQDIGVPTCDKILKTYEACVMPKAPDASKAQLKAAYDQMRTNWVAVAATPDGKKQLEPVCTQATAQMKQALATYNCAW